MKHALTRKILSFSLAAVILCSTTGLSFPQRAHALVVEDFINLAQNTISAVADTVTSGGITALVTKDYALDPIAWALAKILLQQMSASIVDWINSGFGGNPAFITDLGGFLTNVADTEIGDFIYGSELAFLCSPFELDVRAALALQYQPFQRKIQCTLSEVAENIDGFVNGGVFSEGGWDGWYQLSTKPRNNPYGAILTASAELNTRIADAQDRQRQQLDWGNGFLSWQECEYDELGGTGEHCTTLTPGTVIESQLIDTFGSGVRQLELADEFNEIVSALVVYLANQVLGGGGVSGLSQPPPGGGPSYVEQLQYSYQNEVDLSTLAQGRETEVQYRSSKESSLSYVRSAKAVLETYASETSGAGCSYADEMLESRIIPLEQRLVSEIAAINATLVQFDSYYAQVQTAQTNEEAQAAFAGIQTVTFHTAIDVLNANEERDGIQEEMGTITFTAQDTCRVSF